MIFDAKGVIADMFRFKTVIRAPYIYSKIRVLIEIVIRYEKFFNKYTDIIYFPCVSADINAKSVTQVHGKNVSICYFFYIRYFEFNQRALNEF